MAEVDQEGRLIIWQAICDAAEELRYACQIYTTPSPDLNGKVCFEMSIADVETWRLIEALSLVAILGNASRVFDRNVWNIFGRTGPISIEEDGRAVYLWAQPEITGYNSALGARPDLVVTTTREKPSPSTVLRIIECKCRQQLGAADIRAEFGKAHDLRATSYFIWSYHTPKQSVVRGAESLGLTLETLSLDTGRRHEWAEKPASLFHHAAAALEKSRMNKPFARMLQITNSQVQQKTAR